MIKNLTRGQLLSKTVRICDKFWTRLIGLIDTPHIDDSEACWIKPCNSIHTFGMKYPIDACFLDKNNKVVAILKDLKPNHFSPIYFDAHSVLEFSANSPHNCNVGDQLDFMEDPDEKKLVPI